jgi:hypothetical protein
MKRDADANADADADADANADANANADATHATGDEGISGAWIVVFGYNSSLTLPPASNKKQQTNKHTTSRTIPCAYLLRLGHVLDKRGLALLHVLQQLAVLHLALRL